MRLTVPVSASVPWLVLLALPRPRIDWRCIDRRTRILKRALDIVLAASLLVLALPLLVVVALLVKLTSRGPVIYRQVRVGMNLPSRSKSSSGDDGEPDDRRALPVVARVFVLYKIRTMEVDAERDGARFSERGDRRVTRIGRLLRRSRIDELPQLWNVLRGEMSMVGPRPERPEFVEDLCEEIPEFALRLGMKPGLTGIAQVVNGYDNDLAGFRRKTALDLLYLQNCCWRNDFKILLRTIRVVLTGEGAV